MKKAISGKSLLSIFSPLFGVYDGRRSTPSVPNNGARPRRDRRQIWLASSFWCLVAASFAVAFGPNLRKHIVHSFNPQWVNDDARQQIFPFFRFEEAGVFAGDYVTSYYLDVMPVIYRALYRVAAAVGGSVTLSKLLPYLLLAVTLFAVGRAAHRLSGAIAGATAIGAILGHHIYLMRMGGGLPRSFAFPTAALVCCCLIEGHVRLLALLTVLASGLYPVVAVVAGGCLAIWLLFLPRGWRGEAQSWSFVERVKVLGLATLASIAVLLPQSLGSRKYGGLISVTRAAEFPEIGPLGRYIPADRAPFEPLFTAWRSSIHSAFFCPKEPLSGSVRSLFLRWTSLDEKELIEAIVLLALVYWAWMLKSSIPLRRLLVLPITIGCAYVIASRNAPFFFLPQRYLVYTTPVLSVILVSAAIGAIAQVSPRRVRWAGSAVSVCLAVAFLAATAGRGSPDTGLRTRLRTNDPILRAISALPKNALIASWPMGVTNNIPYVTRRPVLLSYETHQAFHVEYARTMRRRVNALIDAFSATNPAPLLRLYRDFGVTHVVYHDEFIAAQRPSYFRPFDEEIVRAHARLGGQLPLIAQLERPFVLLQHGSRTLISLERLAMSYDATSDGSTRKERDGQ
jgi:hypothetical protein